MPAIPELDPVVLTGLSILSVVTLLGTAALVPFVVARIPEDYFARTEAQRRRSRGVMWLVGAVLKNALGLVLLAAGLAMLVLPGQGVLTVLAGLSLLNFPGKRALEVRLISRPAVWRTVTWLRRRCGRPPLRLPEAEAQSPGSRPPDRSS
ncbi:MAG: hypothetical protein B7733_09795 [Myxococcales bacterium FL481]|nr:MAG: hypothetical protein B7733_09795 [Myxococcales bacterium FL481]